MADATALQEKIIGLWLGAFTSDDPADGVRARNLSLMEPF